MRTYAIAAAATLSLLAFPLAVQAQSSGSAAGAATGAVGGAIVGGPVGAVVGGVGGAIVGGLADEQRPPACAGRLLVFRWEARGPCYSAETSRDITVKWQLASI